MRLLKCAQEVQPGTDSLLARSLLIRERRQGEREGKEANLFKRGEGAPEKPEVATDLLVAGRLLGRAVKRAAHHPAT